FWHPGLGAAARGFLERAGLAFDVEGHPGHALDTVYCNYIVARPVFWRAWLDLANALYDEAEDDASPDGAVLRGTVAYGMAGAAAPLKV
ncbi:hypothetical protein OFD51_31560, partial [Escherichia coli]|nr:hypothetical protein [Escherichia coli]